MKKLLLAALVAGVSSAAVSAPPSASGSQGLAAQARAAAAANAVGKADKDSPAFSGTPTAPTQAVTDNSTNLATTAFTWAAGAYLDARSCSGMPAAASNANVTTALDACMKAAVVASKTLFLPYQYVVDWFRIPPYGRVLCAGENSAGWTQSATGSGTPPTSDGKYATVAVSDVTSGAGVTVEHCLIYGNKNQIAATSSNPGNTNPIEGLLVSNEGATQGGTIAAGTIKPHHNLNHINVQLTSGNGVEIGAYSRDSRFDNFVVYGANGYGLLDGGVDAERSNWNIGQSKYDGVYSVGSILRYTNFKSWGSGQYSTTATKTDGSYAAGFYFFKTNGVSCINCQSQESQGYGFRIEGQGSLPTNGFIGELLSDGDNIAGMSCANVYRVYNSQISLSCGRLASGLFGTPYGALTIATSSGNEIKVTYGLISSYALAIAADSQGLNRITANANDVQVYAGTFAASYTPRPDQHWTETLTLTGNTTINVPPKLNVGDRVRLLLTQDSTGGRTITFNAAYKMPSTCTPSTTAGKLNVLDFLITSPSSLAMTGCQVGM